MAGSTSSPSKASPSTPGNLPPELLFLVCEHLLTQSQKATLACLLQCSRQTYELAAPFLYRELTITRQNAPLIFAGLAKRPSRFRRSRRREISASTAIGWGELLSTNFYLEWSAMYDARANESLRSGREYLVWPSADADSESEDEEERAIPSSTIQYPFPSFASHRRKLALFETIDTLHIEEIPSRDLCEELEMILRSGGHLFGEVKRLSVGAKAYWSIVDWEDRHLNLIHPFRKVIAECHPDNLCVTYPTIDMYLEKRYMMPRVVTNEEHLSRLQSVDQYTFLRFELERFLAERFGTLIKHLAALWSDLRSVTVHNVSAQQIPQIDGMKYRMFYHPCACRDGMILDPGVNTPCYSHWEADDRLEAIRSMARGRKTESWDFVDCSWEEGWHQGHDDEAFKESFWAGFSDSTEQEVEEMKRRVKIGSSKTVGGCTCCQKNRLSHARVSTCPRYIIQLIEFDLCRHR